MENDKTPEPTVACAATGYAHGDRSHHPEWGEVVFDEDLGDGYCFCRIHEPEDESKPWLFLQIKELERA